MDTAACKTLETRLIFHRLKARGELSKYNDYLLGKISRENFVKENSDDSIQDSVINLGIGGENNSEIFRRINLLAENKSIDLIIGGPPCQAYSLVGRARDKKGMKDDPRNYLYKEYAKFLKRYQPRVFVFENVLGLITAEKGMYFRNMQKYFRSVGYNLAYQVLKSEDFGVLQKRRRIILIGWRKDLVNFSYPTFETIENPFSIKDLLNDLKPIYAGESSHITDYQCEASEYLKRFDLRNGVNFVTQHIARPHNENDLAIYKIAVQKLNEGERLKYPDIPKNLKTHSNQKSFLDRFKVVNPDDYSHTMVAHISKDGHHYIHPSMEQNRSISVREAARIQSFPDDYYFEGGRSAAFRQIGNAVPPLMAKSIAEGIQNNIHEQ